MTTNTMDRYFLIEMSSADGQLVAYEQGGGNGRVYINPMAIECICDYPAFKPPKGWAQENIYALITRGGRSFIVQMPPSVITGIVSSNNSFRHCTIEHIGTANAHYIKVVDRISGWLNADHMEAAEDDIEPFARYEDGIARVNIIGHSGFIYRIYGMQAHSIATSHTWYYS